jgi:hypothetical protein
VAGVLAHIHISTFFHYSSCDPLLLDLAVAHSMQCSQVAHHCTRCMQQRPLVRRACTKDARTTLRHPAIELHEVKCSLAITALCCATAVRHPLAGAGSARGRWHLPTEGSRQRAGHRALQQQQQQPAALVQQQRQQLQRAAAQAAPLERPQLVKDQHLHSQQQAQRRWAQQLRRG